MKNGTSNRGSTDNKHPVVKMTRTFYIDEELAPIIKFIWKANLNTSYSCQGDKEILPGGNEGYIAFFNDFHLEQFMLYFTEKFFKTNRNLFSIDEDKRTLRFENAFVSKMVKHLKLA